MVDITFLCSHCYVSLFDLFFHSKPPDVVLSAHRLSTIKDADKIVVLSSGNKLEEGAHSTLLANPEGAYTKLVSAQKLREVAGEGFEEKEEDPEELMRQEKEELGDDLKKSATTRSAASIAISAKKGGADSELPEYGIFNLFFRLGRLNTGYYKVYAMGTAAAIVVCFLCYLAVDAYGSPSCTVWCRLSCLW